MAAKFFYIKKKNLKNIYYYIIIVNCNYFYIIKLFRVKKKYEKNRKFFYSLNP